MDGNALRGSHNLPSPQVVAGGTEDSLFEGLPNGLIKRFLLSINFTLISTGAAFVASIATGQSAAAEGADDMDKLMTAIIIQLTLFWTPNRQAFFLAMTVLRTILGAVNFQDFLGSFKNGVSIPISSGPAAAYQVQIEVPSSLDHMFEDGALFAQGSESIRDGKFQFKFNTSVSPNVVMANGTATVGALQINVKCNTMPGSAHDVASRWCAEILSGYQTPWDVTPRESRLFLADRLTAAVSLADGVTYNRLQDAENIQADTLQNNYLSDVIGPYGNAYDLSQRCTPWPGMVEKGTKLANLKDRVWSKYHIEITGYPTGNINMLDVYTEPINSSARERVVADKGAGGPVSVHHVAPESLPPGTRVGPALAGLLPTRYVRPQAGAETVSGPVAASGLARARQAMVRGASMLFGGYSRGGR